jgi:hypothetical protein
VRNNLKIPGLLAGVLILTSGLNAQTGYYAPTPNPGSPIHLTRAIATGSGAPASGTCPAPGAEYVDTTGTQLYICFVSGGNYSAVTGGGGSGTVTSSTQYDVGYFASTGTTISGISFLQTNGTIFSVNQNIGSVDYQVNILNFLDTTSNTAPNCSPSCTPANNTATSLLINVGSAPDSMFEQLFSQRIGINSMFETSTVNHGVGKAIVGNILMNGSNGIAGQFNCTMTSLSAGADCIGTDNTVIDCTQAGAGRVGNPGTCTNAGNLISGEFDSTVNNSSTSHVYGLYITDQADTFQASNAYGIYLAELNGVSGAPFTPNMTPRSAGLVSADGFSDSSGIYLKSTAPFVASGSTLTTSGTNNETITSTAGTDFTYLWGVNNSAGSTVDNANNIDQIYIAGSACPQQICTIDHVITNTTAQLTTNPGALTNAAWKMVAPSQDFRISAQNSPAVTCPGSCIYQQYLSSTPTVAGQWYMNAPTSFIWQLGGFGSGAIQMSLSDSTGTLAGLVVGNAGTSLSGVVSTVSSGGFLTSYGSTATANYSIYGPATVPANNFFMNCSTVGSVCTETQSLLSDNGTVLTYLGNILDSTATGGSGNVSTTVRSFAGAPTFVGQGSQGTGGSPTVSTTANSILLLTGQGYNGTAYATGGYVDIIPTQTWSGSAYGTEITFATTPNGSTTNTVALTLGQDQSATFAAHIVMSGLGTGTQVSCLGLTNTNQVVPLTGQCGTGSGSGTVTSFSAGTLSPLFTTSVATATTTPALTFTLSNAAQNSVFAGPASGGAGAPSYQTTPTFSATNLTNLPITLTTTGTSGAATYTQSTNTLNIPQYSGGGGSPTWETNGTSLGAQGTGNFINGSGILVTGSASGGVAAITISPDTSILETRVAFAQGGDISCIDATGSSTAYTCNIGVTSGVVLTQNMVINFVPQTTSGASPTLAVNGLAALALDWDINGTLTPVTTGQLTGGIPYKITAYGSGPTAWVVTPQLFFANTGANTALSNLAAVSINTSLLAQTAVDLGSTSAPFRNLYLYGGGTFGTDSFELTGTSTANRTVTLPDNTGTVAELNFAETFSAVQTFGTNISIGGVTATGATGTGNVVFSISPTLTGTPAAPTQTAGDNTTALATDAFVTTAVANAVAGVNPAVAVLAASTATLTGTYVQVGGGIGDTFTITATGAFTLDGVAINTIGQRVLLKNQTSANQNGVYTATIIGTTGISAVFTRALDYDTPSDVNNTGAIPVQSGTANATTSWLLTSQVTSIGSSGSSLIYAQFSYAPSAVALLGATQTFSGANTFSTIIVNTSLTINGGTAQTGTQGTDTKILTAGTVSGTAAALCTDSNGGATTSGCPSASGGSITGSGLTAYNAYYMSSSGLAPAEANSLTTCPSAIYVASTTTTAVYSGVVTNGSWTWTPGGIVYVSPSSAGGLTQTAPATGDVVCIAGQANSATSMLISPTMYPGVLQ